MKNQLYSHTYTLNLFNYNLLVYVAGEYTNALLKYNVLNHDAAIWPKFNDTF